MAGAVVGPMGRREARDRDEVALERADTDVSLVKGVLVMNIVLTVQEGAPMASTVRYTKGGAR
jgi:hypothetical protein